MVCKRHDVLVAKCKLDMLLLIAHGGALLHNLCMHVTHIVAACTQAACTADEEHGFYESLFRDSLASSGCTRSHGRSVLAACCCTAVLPVSNHITIMHEHAIHEQASTCGIDTAHTALHNQTPPTRTLAHTQLSAVELTCRANAACCCNHSKAGTLPHNLCM